jgi:hypothetical protein
MRRASARKPLEGRGNSSGKRVRLGQADGTEVEFVVFGDEAYARYETPAGYSVVYDE